MVKLHGRKKIKIVGSFSGISTTSKLEMDFFSQLRTKRCMCHVYVTQSSLKRPIHVTRKMAVVREFRCGLSKFHCRNEVTQGQKVQAIKL